MTLPPILHISYKFDDDALWRVYNRHSSNYGPFVAPSRNWRKDTTSTDMSDVIPNFRIILSDGIEDDDATYIAQTFCKRYGLSETVKVTFFHVSSNTTLDWHKDLNGSITCINHIISDEPAPISFEDGDYSYTTALIDIQRYHKVINGNKDRVVFRMTFVDPADTYEKIYNKISAINTK